MDNRYVLLFGLEMKHQTQSPGLKTDCLQLFQNAAHSDFSHGHRRKAGRELTTALDRMNERTLSEKSAGAGHRAVSLHRDCVLVEVNTVICKLNLCCRSCLS